MFCRVEITTQPVITLSLEGQPRGVACADVAACRLRLVLGGLHEWSREDREAVRRISDVLSVLPDAERKEALDDMRKRLIDE
jgi:hypothetical protein